MDKFIIIKVWTTAGTSLVESLDNASDAAAYANIMRRKDPEHKYLVYQLNEEL